MASAGQAVAETPELLEMILLALAEDANIYELDRTIQNYEQHMAICAQRRTATIAMQTLLLSQRVSKAFCNLIEGSKKLQQALHFRLKQDPAVPAVVSSDSLHTDGGHFGPLHTYNALFLMKSYHDKKAIEIDTLGSTITWHWQSSENVQLEYRCPDLFDWKTAVLKTGSWQRVLLAQPPMSEDICWSPINIREHIVKRVYVQYEPGMTLGDLVDLFMQVEKDKLDVAREGDVVEGTVKARLGESALDQGGIALYLKRVA